VLVAVFVAVLVAVAVFVGVFVALDVAVAVGGVAGRVAQRTMIVESVSRSMLAREPSQWTRIQSPGGTVVSDVAANAANAPVQSISAHAIDSGNRRRRINTPRPRLGAHLHHRRSTRPGPSHSGNVRVNAPPSRVAKGSASWPEGNNPVYLRRTNYLSGEELIHVRLPT
jgi:hypothetical protein